MWNTSAAAPDQSIEWTAALARDSLVLVRQMIIYDKRQPESGVTMPMNLQPEDEPKWRRRLASAANNRAWDLAEMPSRTRQEDGEMLHAAHASAYLWSTIGTERNAALADLLLGQVHSLLGNAVLADRFAKSARGFFTGVTSAPSELAMVHAVAANAAYRVGDPLSHQREYAASQSAAEAITNAREKELLLATLRVIPKPIDGAASEG
jgi:hypothetical protein